jgi:capsular exopolysaccharide synthesis family protein
MEAKKYSENKIEPAQDFEQLLPDQPVAPQLPPPLPYTDDEVDAENAPKPKKANIIPPLIRILLRKGWLSLIPTILFGGLAFKFVPTPPLGFSGSFRLLVEPLTSEGAKAEPGALTGTDSIARAPGLDYVTQLQILQSPHILDAILKQIQTKYPDFPKFQLEQGMIVQQVVVGKNARDGATKLIEVVYQDTQLPMEGEKKTQERVLFVLDAIADKYLKYSLEERRSRISEGVKFIDEQLPGLEAEMNRIQNQIQELQQKYNLTDLSVLASELAGQRSTLNTQLFEVNQLLAEQRTLYLNLKQSLGITTNNEAIEEFTMLQRTRYQDLLARLQAVETQISTELVRFKEENPVISVLREEQQNILAALRAEAQTALGENLTGTENNPQLLGLPNQIRQGRIVQIVDTLTQIDILEVRKRVLEQEQLVLQQRTRDFPKISRRYNQLQNKLQISNQTFYQLLDNRQKLLIEASQKEVPWQLVAQPDLPRYPDGSVIPIYGESRKKLLMMATIAGLGLGLVVVLLIDIARNIFFTPQDIDDLVPFPMLGIIPRDRGVTKLAMSSEDTSSLSLTNSGAASDATQPVGGYSDNPEFLEAFSLLFAKLRFLEADFPIRSLTISSAQVGDGKSTVALHLAQTAALMGQRVLLVDANLRRPALHQMLDIPNFKGLTDLLINKMSPKEIISRSPLADNLFVLTAGAPTLVAPKLLASPQMRYLMEELESKFDLIIYDTAHLLELVDTNFLAEHTDGILMVVAVKKTKFLAVNKVINDLKNFNLSILGTIANDLR